MAGIFGGLFDFNHNGKLEPNEEAMEFALFMGMTEEKDDAFSVDEFDEFDLLDDD